MCRRFIATYFTGVRNSGKTTAGRRFAESYGLPFFDIDRETERKSGRTVREIFEEDGGVTLNSVQHGVLLSLLEEQGSGPCVIALGGGAADNPLLMETAYKTGTLVYLRASFALLYSRLMAEGELPPFIDKSDPEKSFRLIYDRRSAIYESLADRIVDTDNTDNTDNYPDKEDFC